MPLAACGRVVRLNVFPGPPGFGWGSASTSPFRLRESEDPLVCPLPTPQSYSSSKPFPCKTLTLCLPFRAGEPRCPPRAQPPARERTKPSRSRRGLASVTGSKSSCLPARAGVSREKPWRRQSPLGGKHRSNSPKGQGLTPPLHHMQVPEERSRRALRISACTSA